jgi:hypothetical protein
MHRVLRVTILALLLAATFTSLSAYALPPAAQSAFVAVPPIWWQPVVRLWVWLSGQTPPKLLIAPPQTGQHSVAKGVTVPAPNPPAVQPNDGMGADPNG